MKSNNDVHFSSNPEIDSIVSYWIRSGYIMNFWTAQFYLSVQRLVKLKQLSWFSSASSVWIGHYS